jgi:hypothetical protein
MFFALLLIASNVSSQNIQSSSIIRRQYSPAEKAELFHQALAIFSLATIPSSYRDQISGITPQRCATTLLMDIRQNLDNFDADQRKLLTQLLARPELPLSFSRPAGGFKIHYTVAGVHSVPTDDLDASGVPDFVEETAIAFEESFDAEVTDLGYRPAPGDNNIDGPEYDVYIQSLGSQAYGFTQGESQISGTPQNDYTSYIVIDNDFNDNHATTGADGARVTAAHEYFHAIQFGYRLFANTEEPFYYELCSTWMEDVVYDDINDYYAYLPSFFNLTDIPFNRFHSRSYGQAVWNHFLVKSLNDADLIRRSWEIMESGRLAMDEDGGAIEQSLAENGGSFKNAFAEFALWNYFTGPNRADEARYYEEGSDYPEVRLNGDFQFDADTTVADSSRSLTARYYKFTTDRAGEISVNATTTDPVNWIFHAVVQVPGGLATPYTFLNCQNLGSLPAATEIVIIPVNLTILAGPNLPQLGTRYSRFTFTLAEGALCDGEARGITNVFPNPFVIGQHSRVTFEFASAPTVDLEARILNAEGRVIKTVKFRDGDLSLGRSFFIWDGAGEDAQPASGIYIFQLKQDDFVDMQKFALIRK